MKNFRAALLMLPSALTWTALAPSCASAQTDAMPRTVLPIPAAPSRAVIGADLESSTPDFPRLPTAPAGAPNVILILTDDTGFGAASAFGGPVPTPNLERLAASGVTYNQFHTTAMCSPTRAALLTGRNTHAIGTGVLTDFANGFPGYTGIIPKSAATVAEILKDNGYATAHFGKHHNVPIGQRSVAGGFDQWPVGLGFENFFGFIGADTDQWNPTLVRDNTLIGNPAPGDLLDKQLADQAINWVHNRKAAAPDKPFFLYYAPGTAHTPHQAPADWIARFRGKFDSGWERMREDTLARQKALGLVPKQTRLPAWPADLPRWSTLSPDERKVQARFMEVYAAMLAYQDAQIGRLLDEVGRMGLRDNTLVIFIEGDNGSDSAGSPEGKLTEVGELANRKSTLAEKLGELDRMGGPESQPLFSTGWALALDAPFPHYKQIASHLGGTRNGAVISWPARITGRGVRGQYHHVIDVMPTILEAAGVPVPESVNGVRQQPVDGVSMEYSFNDAKAPGRRVTQYYEMLGNRAIYHDGWLANTTPRQKPWEMVFSPTANQNLTSQYTWELYDLKADFSQSTDLAARNPGKLREMQALFDAEARRYNVYPLDDRTSFARTAAMYARYITPRDRYVYWGKRVSAGPDVWPAMFNRGFTIDAEIRPGGARDSGVIASVGSWFGGWSFYLKDGRPTVAHAFSQLPGDQFTLSAPTALPANAAARVRFAFAYDGGGMGRGGTVSIALDGRQIAQGRLERSIVNPIGMDETFDVGFDGGVPVTRALPGTGDFPGAIDKVVVSVGKPGEAGLPSRD